MVTVSPVGVYPPYEFNETTTITYTARDTSGNKKRCTFKITVEGNWKSHVSKSFSRYNCLTLIKKYLCQQQQQQQQQQN